MGATNLLTTVLSSAALILSAVQARDVLAVRPGILFTADHESGVLANDWPNPSQYCCDHSVTLVQSPVRAGKYALKIHRKASDPFPYGDRNRVEVSSCCSKGKGKRWQYKNDTEYWQGVSIYVPNDFPLYGVGSWHNVQGISGSYCGSDSFLGAWHLTLFDGKWKWRRRGEFCCPCNGGIPWGDYRDIGPVEKGKWTDFVFNFRLDPETGFMKIWMDGKLKIDYDGPVGFNSGVYGGFIKIGSYMSNKIPLTRTLYIDEFRIGNAKSGYQAVSPSGVSHVPPSKPTAPSNVDLSITSGNK